MNFLVILPTDKQTDRKDDNIAPWAEIR